MAGGRKNEAESRAEELEIGKIRDAGEFVLRRVAVLVISFPLCMCLFGTGFGSQCRFWEPHFPALKPQRSESHIGFSRPFLLNWPWVINPPSQTSSRLLRKAFFLAKIMRSHLVKVLFWLPFYIRA